MVGTQKGSAAKEGNEVSKDSFKGIITGTVERVAPYAKGDMVTVGYKANPNAKYPDRATIWCVGSSPVAVGDRVIVSGQVSVRVTEYKEQHYAQVSVNFPEFQTAAPAEPVAAEPWNDSTPF